MDNSSFKTQAEGTTVRGFEMGVKREEVHNTNVYDVLLEISLSLRRLRTDSGSNDDEDGRWEEMHKTFSIDQ